MTSTRLRRSTLTLAALLTVAVTTVTVPAVADRAIGPRVERSTTIEASSRATTGRVVTKVSLRYRGSQENPVSTKSANIPGIGDVDIFCRANVTMIRLTARARSPRHAR